VPAAAPDTLGECLVFETNVAAAANLIEEIARGRTVEFSDQRGSRRMDRRDADTPSSAPSFPGQAFTDPPYDYKLDAAADVPALVQRCAGPQ
jgi:hypothetical protein